MSDLQALVIALSERFPGETASILADCPPADVAAFLAAVPVERAAPAIQRMAPPHVAASLAGLSDETAAGLVAALPTPSAASVLRCLGAEAQQRLLARLSQARQLQLRLMLRHPSRSVAAWTDASVQPTRSSASAGAVRDRLTREAYTGHYLYVVDDAQHYRGAVALPVLYAAADGTRIGELASRSDETLRASLDVESALDAPMWALHDELPVVDADRLFLGSVRYAALRRARSLLQAGAGDAERPSAEGGMMKAANLYYLAMAGLMDGAIGRHDTANTEPGAGS